MSETSFKIALITGVIILAIPLVIFTPIFSIWAVNILFGLTIPITFKTWLSAFWLGILVGGTKYSAKT